MDISLYLTTQHPYFNCLKFSFSVHPCDKDTKGGCQQTCNKDGDKAKCSCAPVDFKLGEDGKSCDPGRLYFIFYKAPHEAVAWVFAARRRLLSLPGPTYVPLVV